MVKLLLFLITIYDVVQGEKIPNILVWNHIPAIKFAVKCFYVVTMSKETQTKQKLRETDSRPVSRYIPRPLRYLKVHCRVQNSLPL
jgi:hypothetical protein